MKERQKTGTLVRACFFVLVNTARTASVRKTERFLCGNATNQFDMGYIYFAYRPIFLWK
jgi:hypothetical protein